MRATSRDPVAADDPRAGAVHLEATVARRARSERCAVARPTAGVVGRRRILSHRRPSAPVGQRDAVGPLAGRRRRRDARPPPVGARLAERRVGIVVASSTAAGCHPAVAPPQRVGEVDTVFDRRTFEAVGRRAVRDRVFGETGSPSPHPVVRPVPGHRICGYLERRQRRWAGADDIRFVGDVQRRTSAEVRGAGDDALADGERVGRRRRPVASAAELVVGGRGETAGEGRDALAAPRYEPRIDDEVGGEALNRLEI